LAQLTQPLPLTTRADVARADGRAVAGQLALPIVTAAAAVLYLVNLTISGWANTYYALAAQAASQSWTALFFGSLDASSFITLDKPPLAILPMAISVRLLGLSSFAILLPEALLGVGTVVVLYLTVRRSFGTAAAFIAGLVASITPVAVLIFRFDNPDALLTFLLVTAAYALTRGLETGRIRWALAAAVLVGFAFLTKYLQAYLVLPAFALTWLLCAPGSLRRRVAGLLASLATVLVASGWWVAIVALLPASARPYIGGSTNNSVLDLIFGYDGLGRILGNSLGGGSGAGPVGGGGPVAGGAGFGGTPGILRLFNVEMAGEIAWLLPAAIIAVGATLVLYRAARRTDGRRAAAILWGGWLAGHVVVFSLMSGIIHSYYTVVMAPAIAALVGAGSWELWQRREQSGARLVLAASLVVTGLVAWLILDRTPAFVPGVGVGVLAVCSAAGLVLALPSIHIEPRVARAAAVVGLIAILVGPAAYSAATIAQAHSGGDAAAGPAGDGMAGNGNPTVNQALVDYLVANQGSARWIVAVNGSQSAAAIQLAAQQPVMSMGGFNGTDDAPTLQQLQAYVASGEIRYVLLGGGAGPGGFGAGPGGGARGFGGGPGRLGGGTQSGSQGVSTWVASRCVAVSVDGSTTTGLYDCAGAA
jgi:4-amino-4-deoxy-L-arabinose transferase-like glycosyltransferase